MDQIILLGTKTATINGFHRALFDFSNSAPRQIAGNRSIASDLRLLFNFEFNQGAWSTTQATWTNELLAAGIGKTKFNPDRKPSHGKAIIQNPSTRCDIILEHRLIRSSGLFDCRDRLKREYGKTPNRWLSLRLQKPCLLIL